MTHMCFVVCWHTNFVSVGWASCACAWHRRLFLCVVGPDCLSFFGTRARMWSVCSPFSSFSFPLVFVAFSSAATGDFSRVWLTGAVPTTCGGATASPCLISAATRSRAPSHRRSRPWRSTPTSSPSPSHRSSRRSRPRSGTCSSSTTASRANSRHLSATCACTSRCAPGATTTSRA